MNNLDHYIAALDSNALVIAGLFDQLTEEQLRWKPVPEKWNLQEVICHLLDEEKEDFRARLKMVLENPSIPFPPIDPQGWVLLRNYAAQNPVEKLKGFMEERKLSVNWLKTLHEAPWENTHYHPVLGAMTAKMIVANWLAHDYLHIKQIIQLKYNHLKDHSLQNLSYAGNW